MRARTTIQQGREGWRLALNLSVIAFVGGVLFVLIGAWQSTFATFLFGVLCAGVAAVLIRRKSE